MDDKIYELMAQAEILQEHALALQNKASEAILEIPEAIDGVKEKLRSTALWSALIWVITGAVVVLGVWIAIMWSTKGLLEEQNRLQWEVGDLKGQVKNLRKEVQAEEEKLAKIHSESWGIEVGEIKGQRWLKLGKGYEVGKTIEWKDGREGIEVNRKK